MNDNQVIAIRCAMADLIHAYTAPSHYDIDWKELKETILDLNDAFPFLADEFNEEIERLLED